MPFVLRYLTKTGQHQYVTKKKGFTKQADTHKLILFQNLKEARNFHSNHQNNTQLFGKMHDIKNFTIYNLQNKQQFPLVPSKNNKKIPNIKLITDDSLSLMTLTQFLNNKQHHAIALDLEFYGNTNNPLGQQSIQQIAGVGIDQQFSFDYYPFSATEMPDSLQLKFLRHTNLPYQEAQKANLTQIIKRVEETIQAYQIDTIISWDNKYDFKMLSQAGFDNLFQNMHKIDLQKLVALELSDNGSMRPNLAHFCSTLNLQNQHAYHDAYYDSLMIKKLCEYYQEH